MTEKLPFINVLTKILVLHFKFKIINSNQVNIVKICYLMD